MTKEKAREILNDYVSSVKFIGLPIFDENIYSEHKNGFINKDGSSGSFVIENWSFRGLLKIAYDL